MTTPLITLLAESSIVMMTSGTTVQFFIVITFLPLKDHMITESYTRDHFILNLLNWPKAR